MAKSKRRPGGPRGAAPKSSPKPRSKPSPEEQAARVAERERRVAEREAAKRRALARSRRRHWVRVAAVLGVVAIVAGVVSYRVVSKRREISRIIAAAEDAARSASCSKIQKPRMAGRDHIAPDRTGTGYTSVPPTSGPHFTTTAGTGVREAPVRNEQAIHNLEHGGVVIHHKGLPADQLEALTAKVRDELDDTKVLLAPNPALPGSTGIAYTGWRRLQTCERYDEEVLDTFLRLYLAPRGKDVSAPEKDQPI